jgi:simple sugar transport system ATP-binding protein
MRGIRFHQVGKEFSGVPVLSGIELFFDEGRIHAIVGENGAGKSTLMYILSGVYTPSAGHVSIDGNDAGIASPKDAARLGIGMVHQHFMLIDTLKVWQNIILGAEPRRGIRIDKKAAFALIRQTGEKYGIVPDLDTPAGLLPVGEQQRVEILKVLCRDAKYIILDEPTSVLTPGEITGLLESIRRLKAMGKTILFISHKLEEVMAVADTITVLRGGKSQGMVEAADAAVDDIVQKMVGRRVDFGRRVRNPRSAEGAAVLRIRDLRGSREAFSCPLDGLSLELREGEILGLAGVDGNGQSELVKAILGIEPPAGGSIILGGEDITGKKTPELRRERIACIPPDRQEQGLVLEESIVRNATLGCEDRRDFRRGPFLSPKKFRKAVRDLIDRYGVVYNRLDQNLGDLSGGNQQKIILARECEWKGTQLILAVNPTRGLDIGAIEFVYGKLNQYKCAGKAILLISTELQEILTLSDRIAVMFRGAIVYTRENEGLDIEEIGAYMAGVRGRVS